MFSIIGESNVRTFTKESNFKQVYQYACLSTDNKPTTGISNGSTCFVMDSGKTYIFDEENGEWVEVEGSGGGGGGGGDFSTAEVTIVNTLEEGIWSPLLALDDNVLAWNAIVGAGETQVFKIPIPTGGAYVNPTDLLGTVSGDITFENGLLTITGNGTFTVTGID